MDTRNTRLYNTVDGSVFVENTEATHFSPHPSQHTYCATCGKKFEKSLEQKNYPKEIVFGIYNSYYKVNGDLVPTNRIPME